MAALKTLRVSERGNILWFLLIGIVLLGAITILLSRSGSSVDQSGDVEKQRIKASQVMRYARGLEAAVQDLKIRGCSENEISFENPVQTGYANGSAPSDQSCHIFYRSGAGLTWRGLSNEVLASGEAMLITGEITVFGMGGDAGSTGADLSVAIPVSEALCQSVNRTFSISITTSDITSDIATWPAKYTGSFSSVNELGNGAGKAPVMTGEATGCIIDNNGQFVFYHVLIPR